MVWDMDMVTDMGTATVMVGNTVMATVMDMARKILTRRAKIKKKIKAKGQSALSNL